MVNNSLTERQAYVAAYLFFSAYFDRGGEPEELITLLTGMTFLKKGTVETQDPAFWHDWKKAVETALEDENAADVNYLK